jgi:hypothetical protein
MSQRSKSVQFLSARVSVVCKMKEEYKFDNWEAEQKFKRDCETIYWLTGKKWQVVMNTYTLPELLRLQGAMIAYDCLF